MKYVVPRQAGEGYGLSGLILRLLFGALTAPVPHTPDDLIGDTGRFLLGIPNLLPGMINGGNAAWRAVRWLSVPLEDMRHQPHELAAHGTLFRASHSVNELINPPQCLMNIPGLKSLLDTHGGQVV